MKFDLLQLSNFRNYQSLNLEIPSGVVVFHGENGQGKTNLVESIFYLLRGSSFRPSTNDSIRYHGVASNAPIMVRGSLLQDNLKNSLELKFDELGKKSFSCNPWQTCFEYPCKHPSSVYISRGN